MTKKTAKKNEIIRKSIELPKDPLTGKRRKKEFKGPRHIVEAKIKEWQLKIERGEIDGQGNMTLAAYLKLWLNVYCKKLAITTVQGYERYINKHIIPEIGAIKLGELLPIQITNLYNKMADKNLSSKTILQTHSILRKSLQDAVKNGFIFKNPCTLVDRPSAKQYKPKTIYTEMDFLKLIELSKGTEHELPILLAGVCGLRRSEVFGLSWEDIDIESQTIRIHQAAVPIQGGVTLKSTKTYSSERTITYPSYMNEIFKKKKGIGLIFTEPGGKIFNGGNYSHRFKNFLEKHHLKHIRFHDLRHFNATLMLKSGISDKVASARLGHANPGVTRSIYQHVTEELDKEAAITIEKALNPVVKMSSDAK